LKLSFSAIILAALIIFGSTVSALPPGTDDEISARLKPHGKLARAEKAEGQMIMPAAAAPAPQLPKISLSTGSEHEVKMLNSGSGGSMIFEPAAIKVSVGDTVHFKATDLAHNSASIAGMIPSGAKAWAGSLSRDISVTLNTEGVYVYQCDPHVVMAMVGVIQVGEAVNIEEIEVAAKEMEGSFAMNQQRLEQYLGQL
jgi:pseudoazurin